MAVADLPTYGYRRVWALLRRESERDGLPVVNAKRVYRIMRTHNLLLERKPADPCRKRAHKGRVAVAESNRRWCSDGFEFRCDNGEKLRVTFAQDCCDREIIDWAASTGGYDKETVQDVMLGAVENASEGSCQQCRRSPGCWDWSLVRQQCEARKAMA
nr:IS2 resolvase [Escherichia coli]